MINVRLATEDDKKAWNIVAYKSPEATYAHTWEWKEVIEEGLGLESICLIAENKRGIVGIYPAFLKPKFEKSIVFKKAGQFKKLHGLWSPLDTTWDYGGPCTIPGTDKAVLEALIIAMEQQSKKHRVTDIRISPFFNNNFNKHLTNILIANNYRTSPRLTYILDIWKSEDEIWHGIKKNARRYINKPMREGVVVKELTDEIGLVNFYNSIINLNTNVDVCAYVPPYSFFKCMLYTLKPKNMLKIHNVFYNDELIGGSISFHFKDVVTFRYAKIIEKHQYLHPHYLLHWVRIKENREFGYKYIDMGGIPNDKNSGIYFFKTRWGGHIENVDWYVKDISFKRIRYIRRKIMGGEYLGGHHNKKIK